MRRGWLRRNRLTQNPCSREPFLAEPRVLLLLLAHFLGEASRVEALDSRTRKTPGHLGPASSSLFRFYVALIHAEIRKCVRFAHSLFYRSEEGSERLFSDEVQDANLSDFSLAPAFLLGNELATMCTVDEATAVETFLKAVSNESDALWMLFVRAGRQLADREEEVARTQLAAFAQGFRRAQ